MSPTVTSADTVYKICPGQSWREASARGEVSLSADDARDGYVHLSAAHQVRGSLARHFAGQSGLVLLALRVDTLPEGALVWEASRGGQSYPHLYGRLGVRLVSEVFELALDGSGQHRLPEGF